MYKNPEKTVKVGLEKNLVRLRNVLLDEQDPHACMHAHTHTHTHTHTHLP